MSRKCKSTHLTFVLAQWRRVTGTIFCSWKQLTMQLEIPSRWLLLPCFENRTVLERSKSEMRNPSDQLSTLDSLLMPPTLTWRSMSIYRRTIAMTRTAKSRSCQRTSWLTLQSLVRPARTLPSAAMFPTWRTTLTFPRLLLRKSAYTGNLWCRRSHSHRRPSRRNYSILIARSLVRIVLSLHVRHEWRRHLLWSTTVHSNHLTLLSVATINRWVPSQPTWKTLWSTWRAEWRKRMTSQSSSPRTLVNRGHHHPFRRTCATWRRHSQLSLDAEERARTKLNRRSKWGCGHWSYICCKEEFID